jgi:hypothetical protein
VSLFVFVFVYCLLFVVCCLLFGVCYLKIVGFTLLIVVVLQRRWLLQLWYCNAGGFDSCGVAMQMDLTVVVLQCRWI